MYLSLSLSLSLYLSSSLYIFSGQVMSPDHSDQMSQRLQVSRVALCISKVKVPSVSQWQGHLLSCSGQLKKDHDEDKHKYKDNDKDKYIQRTHSKSDPRDSWPLRHMIRVIMRHDLTKKKIMTRTNTKTKTMTKTNTFREHIQRVIIETCDLWDLWSEWLWDITWPKKDHEKDKYKGKDNDNDKDKDKYI